MWKSAPIATPSLPVSRNWWIRPGAWSGFVVSTPSFKNSNSWDLGDRFDRAVRILFETPPVLFFVSKDPEAA